MAGLLPFKPSWLLKIHIKIAALKLFFLLISISSHKLGTRMINKKSLSLILSKSTEAKYGWQGLNVCVWQSGAFRAIVGPMSECSESAILIRKTTTVLMISSIFF